METKKSSAKFLIMFLSLSLFLAACTVVVEGPPDGNLIPTHVAQTVAADRTQQVMGTPTPDETQPSPTDVFTPTPTATSTIAPTPTETEIPGVCDLAVFVEHVTISPETLVEGGSDFTKVWQILNAGTCTWTTNYAVEFVYGRLMDAPIRVRLSDPVAPGGTTNISVDFTAPVTEGVHVGNWALVNANGVKVPMDNTADGNLQVSVWVNVLDTVVLDFTEDYCDARWQSVVDPSLDCPGDTSNSAPGYVTVLEEGELEDGTAVDDEILVTRPDNGDFDGFISGTYPAFNVQRGDQFMATIGCAPDGTRCNLFFELQYQIGNGPIRTLETWHERHNDEVREVSVDLEELAGESVKFILQVRNNETDLDNEGYWYEPVIMR